MDVVYPRLSNWTCLQWKLHSYHTQKTSAFSAMRGSDALFPNDFGEDLLLTSVHRKSNLWTLTVYFALLSRTTSPLSSDRQHL